MRVWGKRTQTLAAREGSESQRFKSSGVFQDTFTSAAEVFLVNHVREAGQG